MKFLCGGCRTKYQISDDKIRGKVLTIRCKKCNAKILVRESLVKEGGTAIAPVAEENESSLSAEGRSAVGSALQMGGSATLQSAFDVAMRGEGEVEMPTSIAPTPANAEAAGLEWYVALEGVQTGPYAFAELVRKVQGKELGPKHYVWHDGMDGWKHPKDVADLQPYVVQAPEKKKPPPPPNFAALDPARGAEVVDFASRRKEREQKKGSGDHGSGDLALGSGDIERETPSEIRADALKTETSFPTVSSDSRSSGTTNPGSDIHFDKDDLFANLPRATEQEVVSKESTRFFVAAAGVNRHKRRTKLAKALGGGAALAVLLFLGAWATGMIHIEVPVIGKLFEAKADKPETEEVAADDMGTEDAEALKKMLDPAARRKYLLELAAKKKAARLKSGGGGGSGQAVAQALPGTRGDSEATAVAMGNPIGTGAGGGLDVPIADLGGRGDVNLPVVESGTLSPQAIERVINDRKKSVSICYQQSLRGNVELRGRLDFVVAIDPNGTVSKASVETTAFKGTKLARCIASKIKEWRFPAFSGEQMEVNVPFLLEKSSY